MRLKELVEAGEVEEAEGDMNQAITGLSYDSRKVKEACLFCRSRCADGWT